MKNTIFYATEVIYLRYINLEGLGFECRMMGESLVIFPPHTKHNPTRGSAQCAIIMCPEKCEISSAYLSIPSFKKKTIKYEVQTEPRLTIGNVCFNVVGWNREKTKLKKIEVDIDDDDDYSIASLYDFIHKANGVPVEGLIQL